MDINSNVKKARVVYEAMIILREEGKLPDTGTQQGHSAAQNAGMAQDYLSLDAMNANLSRLDSGDPAQQEAAMADLRRALEQVPDELLAQVGADQGSDASGNAGDGSNQDDATHVVNMNADYSVQRFVNNVQAFEASDSGDAGSVDGVGGNHSTDGSSGSSDSNDFSVDGSSDGLGVTANSDGSITFGDGSVLSSDGTLTLSDGSTASASASSTDDNAEGSSASGDSNNFSGSITDSADGSSAGGDNSAGAVSATASSSTSGGGGGDLSDAQIRGALTKALKGRPGETSGRYIGRDGMIENWSPEKVAALNQGIRTAHQFFPQLDLVDLAHLVIAEGCQESSGDTTLNVGGGPGAGQGFMQATAQSVVKDYKRFGTEVKAPDGTVILDPDKEPNLGDPAVNVALWAWYSSNSLNAGQSLDEALHWGHEGSVKDSSKDVGNAMFTWFAGPHNDRHEGSGAFDDYHTRVRDYFVQSGFGSEADLERLLDTNIKGPLRNVHKG